MDGLLDLVTLLVFLCTLCGFYGLLGLSRRRQRRLLSARRLAQLRQAVAAPEAAQAETILRAVPRPPLAGLPLLGPLVAWTCASVDLLGWRRTLALRIALLGLVGLILGLMVGRKTPAPTLASCLLGAAFTLGLFFLTLRQALGKAYEALRRSLPDAIDAITRTCRAGVPISNAFAAVTDTLSGPLVPEFRAIDHWLRLGVPLRQVIQDSAQRVPMPEYRFFAVILIINQESGGRLGETLERLARTMRERQELRMKILAKTSQARASAKIVAALVPGMMLYLYFNAPADLLFLFSDPAGIRVATYMAASVTLGLAIIHLMVRRVG
ncbi:MAG: type II secretion system F family protein [Actinomycetospora chiangmaiensis]|nr:type II secretion system F family protein [Actinomycetospora chiangmaiensis]